MSECLSAKNFFSSKIDQIRKFGEQTSQILELKPKYDVCMSDLTIFHNYPELGGSSPFCHYDNFLEAGGKFLEITMGELNARKINV